MANATGGIIVKTTVTAITPKLTSGLTAVTDTMTGMVCERMVEVTKSANGKSLYENMNAKAAAAASAGAATGATIRTNTCRRVHPSTSAASSISGGTRRKYTVKNHTVNGSVKAEWI